MQKMDIVVTGGSANALGILRSLKNHNLTLLCDSENHPAWHCRFARKYKVRSTKTGEFIEDLLAYGATLSTTVKPLLLLTEEKSVYQVSLHRDQLERYFRFLLCPHELLTTLQSKSGFQQLAERHHAPIPKAVVLQQLFDLPLCNDLQFPCVLKPLEQNEDYSRQFKKAYKVASPTEVETLYRQISTVMPQMIVQEWLEGEDSDIYFCLAWFDQESQLFSSFTGRKLRSWPRHVGGTAACTGAPEAADELSKLTSEFASACGYVGLIGMEYKYDQNRRAFYMIEPTVGRTDYQHEIATLSGHNLMADIVAYFNGDTINRPVSLSSVVWYDEIANENSIANGAPNDLFADVPQIAALWRWSDPGPSIAFWLQRIQNRLRAIMGYSPQQKPSRQ
jgi:predicted ATP-grasp superfamily ATP-dependent carboligase